MHSTVSLILPVFKADPWLPQCLESIKSQSYKDLQLIVVDDPQGSGAAVSRNRGLDRASGELIMFVDADDWLEPEAIQNLVNGIEGVDMVAGSFRKTGLFTMDVKHPTEKLSIGQVAEYAMENLLNPRDNQMLSGCWAKMFRRELVGRFPLLTTAEDMAFNFDYLRLCKSVRFIQDIVYHNRKREGSLSNNFDENNKPGLFGFLEGLEYVERFLHPHFTEDEIRKGIDNSKVYHSMLYFMRICKQTNLPMNDVFKKLYP